IRRPREPYTVKLINSIPTIQRQEGAVAPEPAANDDGAYVQVKNLVKDYEIGGGGFLKLLPGKVEIFRAVNEVSFSIEKGKTFGLVGESGSGKSTCAKMIVGLVRPTSGQITVNGHDIWASGAGHQERRKRVQMIFQDPYASLNPRWRVSDIIAEPMRTLGIARNRSEVDDRVAELLRRVRLDPS